MVRVPDRLGKCTQLEASLQWHRRKEVRHLFTLLCNISLRYVNPVLWIDEFTHSLGRFSAYNGVSLDEKQQAGFEGIRILLIDAYAFEIDE